MFVPFHCSRNPHSPLKQQWRLILLLLTLSLETLLLVTPSPSALFSVLLPRRTTYQHIEVLRQAFISASMALSQLLPLFAPPAPASSLSPEARARQDAELLWPMVERLGRLREIAESELQMMVGLEVRSLLTGEVEADAVREVLEDVKAKMRESYLDLRVKSTAEGGEVWNRAVEDGTERAKRAQVRRPPSASGTGGGGLPSPPPE